MVQMNYGIAILNNFHTNTLKCIICIIARVSICVRFKKVFLFLLFFFNTFLKCNNNVNIVYE